MRAEKLGGPSDELGLGALKLQEQGELNVISVQISKRKTRTCSYQQILSYI